MATRVGGEIGAAEAPQAASAAAHAAVKVRI